MITAEPLQKLTVSFGMDNSVELLFKRVTKISNGGYNGLESRLSYWTVAKKIWNQI